MIGLAITVAVIVLITFVLGFLVGYYFGRAPLVPPAEGEDIP